MTKPVTPRMRLDAMLHSIVQQFGEPLRCAICGKPLEPGQKIQFDHGVADGIGGAHEYRNIRPVHAEKEEPLNCHTRKTSHPRSKATSLGSDTHAAAKLSPKRVAKFVVTKREPGEPKPKSPSPSRPFQRGHRPMRRAS